MAKRKTRSQDRPAKTGPAKRFLALARVSSREQEREGFSLDVQVDALNAYAQRVGGEILHLYRVAETASKYQMRTTFHQMLADARKRADEIDALLFYKFDRAARNLFDFVELERLERDYGIRFLSVCEPVENTAAGKMHRRMLADIATYYTDRLADDVRDGLARRVQSGLIACKAPYGYVNVRRQDGRSVVEIDPEKAAIVKRIFKLYAYEGQTLEGVCRKLADEGLSFSAKRPKWYASHIHRMLLSRVYIGEVPHRDQWYPGVHTPLVDRDTFERVQTMLGKGYTTHTHTYAGGLIRCGHCGRIVTGEQITKKKTQKKYTYYRCSGYNRAGHPRDRVTEAALDKQVLAMFDRLRVGDPALRVWVEKVLKARTVEERQAAKKDAAELERQLARLGDQRDRLLELRLAGEIDAEDYARQATKNRDEQARLRVRIEATDRNQEEKTDVAVKTFELTQNLREKWVRADFPVKRRLLEILWLNCKLVGENLAYEWRKPFDVLAEGLSVRESQGGGI